MRATDVIIVSMTALGDFHTSHTHIHIQFVQGQTGRRRSTARCYRAIIRNQFGRRVACIKSQSYCTATDINTHTHTLRHITQPCQACVLATLIALTRAHTRSENTTPVLLHSVPRKTGLTASICSVAHSIEYRIPGIRSASGGAYVIRPRLLVRVRPLVIGSCRPASVGGVYVADRYLFIVLLNDCQLDWTLCVLIAHTHTR